MLRKSGSVQNPIDLESEALIRGKGQYTDDLAPRNALHGVFVRASVAHGKIINVETQAAKDVPGVVAIITAQELQQAGCQPLTFAAPLPGMNGEAGVEYARTPRPALAGDRIRHIGEAVALVVAESLGAAEDAAELVDVEIAGEAASMSIAEASLSAKPTIWDFAPDNQSYVWQAGNKDAVEKSLSSAACKVSLSLRNQRLAGSPLEPRAALASFDPATKRYTLHCGSQGTAILRQGLSAALGVPPENLHVVTKNVGGGFGLKVYAFPEYVAVMVASRLVGKPVRWTSTRSEALLADQGGRDSSLNITGAFDQDGNSLALSVETRSNLGAYITGVASWVQSTMIAECIAGPYKTPEIAMRAFGILTNSSPVAPYRGSGRPEAAYMLERLMDKAARQIGMDRIEIRRRNLIPRSMIPYSGPMSQVYDSGDFAAVLDKAIDLADWNGFEARRDQSRSKGLYRGIGCSLFLESAGPFLQEPVDLRVTEQGVVEVRTAAVSNGQRHISTLTHIVKQRLGIAIENIKIIAGDSDNVPAGPASVGSRTAMMTGSAVAKAIDSAIERGRMIVGEMSHGRYNDISFEDGVYTIMATGEKVAFIEIPMRVAQVKREGHEVSGSLNGVEVFTSPGYTFPNGCHICEVEVDPKTGAIAILNYVAVDDCGTVLNAPVVEGQLIGGVAQGIGQVLMEEMIYDDDGQVLTGSFMDYAMPRASDMPRRMLIADLPDPTPSNPLGVKGVGEAGTTGSVAAVVNAVEDALLPLGVSDLQMPLTPNHVWQMIQAAR